MRRFQIGLVAVWIITGLLGAGLVDIFIEPDPDIATQLLLIAFLPVIIFPALVGLFSLAIAPRGREDAR